MTEQKSTQQAEQKNVTLSKIQEAEKSIQKLESNGRIRIPANYDYKNALWQAYFLLKDMKDKNKRPVLESCKQSSINSALLEMVTKGLYPAKKHCAFVPYGEELQLQEEYFGKIKQAHDIGLKSHRANVVWKGDEFEYHYDTATGELLLDKHDQSLENISGNMEDIVACYAVLTFYSGHVYRELMTMGQIKNSWNMRWGNGLTNAHNNFPDQMAKKTVLNRALGQFINTAPDFEFDEGEDTGLNEEAKAIEEQENAEEFDVEIEENSEQAQEKNEEAKSQEQNSENKKQPNF